MSQRTRVVMVLVVGLTLVPTALSSWQENDANSGADASDTQAAAAPLLGWTSYGGWLHPNDVDWYAGPAPLSDGACVIYTANPDVTSDMTLSVGSHMVKSPIDSDHATTIAMAGGAGSVVTAGLVPTGPNADEWNDYKFSLRTRGVSSLAPADAGLGYDAGNTVATAAPIAAGCYAGRLNPATLDSNDIYSFSGQSGTDIVITVAATTGIPLSIQILDANGFPIASQVSTSGPLSLALPSTSTYYLTTSSSGVNGATDYIFALIGGGPGNPCRPTCVVS